MKPIYNEKFIGVSYIKSSNKWRAYINEVCIGTFLTRVEAVSARLVIEDIFKNVLSKLDVDSFYFKKDGQISIEVITNTAEHIYINTGILYPNSRKKSTGGAI